MSIKPLSEVCQNLSRESYLMLLQKISEFSSVYGLYAKRDDDHEWRDGLIQVESTLPDNLKPLWLDAINAVATHGIGA